MVLPFHWLIRTQTLGYAPNAAEHVQAAIDSKMYRSTRGYFSPQSSLSFMILYSEKYSSISHSREMVAGEEDASRSEACWRAHLPMPRPD